MSRTAPPSPRFIGAGGGSGLSIFMNGPQMTLLFITSCIALMSAVALAWSIRDEDAGFAWLWAVVFALTSALAAWSLWRL